MARKELEPRRLEMATSSLGKAGVGIAIAFAVATRLYVGARHPIDYNGYWHVFIARNLSREYASLAHPPLFLLLLKASDAIRHSRLSYRAVPLLAGIGSVALLYRVLRRLGAREGAVLGALAMATSTSAILLSTEVQSYSLAVFWILWSFLYYVDLVDATPERIPRRSRALFSVLVCFALLTEYFAGLYLAAAVLAPVLVAALRPTYGRPFLLSLRRRAAADALTLLPPALTSVLLYELVAKPWIRPLNHLPEFYFVPDAETIAAFLTRNMWNLFNLFSPVLIWSPRRAAAIVAAFTAVVLVSMTAEKPRDANGSRAMPAAILTILLAGGMVLGIMGKYPFGGVMRQQFLLLLFALLSGALALDRLLRTIKRPAVRGMVVILGFAAVVGSFSLHLVDLRRPGSDAFLAQTRRFDREFPDTKLVQLDQFNLIGFFMSHHDWDWQYVGRDPSNTLVERYRLTSRDRQLTIIAHRDRWNFDFTDPKIFGALRSSLREDDPRCFSVFCVHTNLYKPPDRKLPDIDPARLEVDLASAARANGEAVHKLLFRGNDVYVDVCPDNSAR